jgi:hypothetical protein
MDRSGKLALGNLGMARNHVGWVVDSGVAMAQTKKSGCVAYC